MAVYDPNKKYSWSREDKFEIDGEQFGLILNAFRLSLSTKEAQAVLIINKANEEIEKVIALAVEKDIIKEQKE